MEKIKKKKRRLNFLKGKSKQNVTKFLETVSVSPTLKPEWFCRTFGLKAIGELNMKMLINRKMAVDWALSKGKRRILILDKP